MTLENAKRLYQHYVDCGMTEEANDIKKNIISKSGLDPSKKEEKKSEKPKG